MKNTPTILTRLRSLLPHRVVTLSEALQIAEQQARRLVDLIDDIDGVQEAHIAGMPRVKIIREELPVSGLSYWNGRTWVIALSRTDSHVRQRFTLLHEFKHIIDHSSTRLLYAGDRRRSAEEQAEVAADYFAGCALVDKRQLKSAWGNRLQHPADLATQFGVSVDAITVRLSQTGLNVAVDRQPSRRCARSESASRAASQSAHPRMTHRIKETSS